MAAATFPSRRGRVFVIGGGSGIGAAMVTAFAAQRTSRIRVNTVSPGWVMTERQVQKWLKPAGEEEIARNQCLPDKLQPDDVAQMVLFLAADDGRMCTAQEFRVDAGWV